MLMQLRMRPELEAAALSRATPSLLRGTAILIVCVVVGTLVGIHNSMGTFSLFESPVGVVLLVLIPILVIGLTLRIKRQSNAAIRTRFASYQVTLDDDCVVRSVDGYPDATLRWDEVTRVVDREEIGLVLSPTRVEDSIILFSELQGYATAKEFALTRVPAPSASVYTANYFLRMGLAIGFVAAVFGGLLLQTRLLIGICLAVVITYVVYGLRTLNGPNITPSTRRRSRVLFLLAPIVLLLRMIFL